MAWTRRPCDRPYFTDTAALPLNLRRSFVFGQCRLPGTSTVSVSFSSFRLFFACPPLHLVRKHSDFRRLSPTICPGWPLRLGGMCIPAGKLEVGPCIVCTIMIARLGLGA